MNNAIDHIVVDVEIQKNVDDLPGKWNAAQVALLRARVERRTNKNGPTVRPELGPCWLWTGAISGTGYGSITFLTEGFSTHAIAFFLTNGRFPESPLQVRHRCDVRACIRPDHLLEGTPRQNIQDCLERGRHASVTHPESFVRGTEHHHGMKTHCPYGHEYTPENTYIVNGGASRACKACALRRAREGKAKKKSRVA